MTKSEILSLRERHLGKSLSISYKKPLKIVRGEGAYLYDEEGRAFLDCVNNVCHVGHCHPHVVTAAQKQIATLNTNTRYLHDHIVAYAKRLTDTLPGDLSVCMFVCTGSEANELALRMARTYTQRKDVIVLHSAYHGHTTALIDISPYKHEGRGGYPTPDYVHKVTIADGYRGPYKYEDPLAGKRYAEDVQNVVKEAEMQGRPIGTFIAESLVSCGGQLEHTPGYLEAAYKYVRGAGGVCIADEVQVGFGRVGSHFWGFETQGVIPDIVTMGKPIGNGHPLAAVVTTPEIANAFANGMEYFNTFGGNPVSCAVGLAVLDVIEDEKLQARAHRVGSYLKGKLSAIMPKHGLIGDVRGRGLFVGIEFVRDHTTLEPADSEAAAIVEAMRDRGILLSTDGPLHNVIKIKPPLQFSEENVDALVENLDAVLYAIE